MRIFSTLAISIIIISCILLDISLKNWQKGNRVIEHDVHWYYGYLPALFIYNDIKLEKEEYKFDNDYYLFWVVFTPEGNKVIKSTMGLAILYSPFFFLANVIAHYLNFPENGFSEPYKLFLLISSIFYLFVGLNFLRKILEYYRFNDKQVAITLLLIGLSSNLLCYASQSAPMPHVYNFCLFAIFIFYTIKWYQNQSIKNTIIIGLLLGIITLIRPSNAVILIFFFLYGIGNIRDVQDKLSFLRKNWFLINVIFFFALLVWIPQFIYWKTVTGNYLFYSYTDEGFFFNKPHILEGLFSFRKGWLVYTPIMIFSLIGIFFLKDDLKKLRLPIIAFLLMNIYIIFSWWCWWYGGTFGQRSVIESYASLSIPLASFIKFVSEKNLAYKIIFACISLFFIWLNIFQTFQFEYKSLHWDAMTAKLYFKQFGKLDRIKNYETLLDYPNYEKAKKSSADIKNVPEDIVTNIYNGKKEIERKRVHLMASNSKFICADRKLENTIVANRDSAYEWETFDLIFFENNECAIRSSDNYFWCCELDNGGRIMASRKAVAQWETFTIVYLENDFIALKAVNGKYISVNKETFNLVADAMDVAEKFKLEEI
jgi:hypothetical protein